MRVSIQGPGLGILKSAADLGLAPCESLEIALAHHRTVYDGLYVALAVARDAVLVTADARLADAFVGSPLRGHVEPLARF